jgi:hypothetical protein
MVGQLGRPAKLSIALADRHRRKGQSNLTNIGRGEFCGTDETVGPCGLFVRLTDPYRTVIVAPVRIAKQESASASSRPVWF